MIVRCTCGKTLRLPDGSAGSRFRCPTCQRVFAVPGQAAAVSSGNAAAEPSPMSPPVCASADIGVVAGAPPPPPGSVDPPTLAPAEIAAVAPEAVVPILSLDPPVVPNMDLAVSVLPATVVVAPGSAGGAGAGGACTASWSFLGPRCRCRVRSPHGCQPFDRRDGPDTRPTGLGDRGCGRPRPHRAVAAGSPEDRAARAETDADSIRSTPSRGRTSSATACGSAQARCCRGCSRAEPGIQSGRQAGHGNPGGLPAVLRCGEGRRPGQGGCGDPAPPRRPLSPRHQTGTRQFT